ncbi:polysaccharide pyruvyl transferase family protein [Marinagarivorans cellulosilyticus]|uniref:Radical SAM core domain-containing protein n=1 Tax=Marinagarivorans cellulosilyticus TaxID=2721545 RepID=A0AAN1WIP4_9GAMM|nr:polysaccharide pyruvyl transferase family protein [Marinagarivorans cellulosilyticus]BCD98331.1 hypothetical protein MARGE09_P2532 [Marinagarivorans cellulosilyticus]
MKLSKLYRVANNCVRQSKPKLEKPKVIQFPVIDICNSRCQMCRIWENKQSTDITVDELKLGLNNELFSEVEAIGFNGGEPTLRSDLIDMVRVVVECLPALKHVSLITNAFKYKQVIEQIDGMASVIKQKNINFDVMVSLDGFESVHDAVRGRDGNFENAKHVIRHIMQSKLVDNVRIGCTVIRENVLHLAPLLDFCIENKVYIKYRLGIPHQRLYTQNLLDPYALTFEEKYEFVEFLEGLISNYETSVQQNFFYRSLIDQVIYDEPRQAGCDWQHRGATITAKGELAYCAVESKALMSNISDGDANKVYFKNEGHLNEIIKTKCDSCHHDYVGLPPAAEYRRQLFARLNNKFHIKSLIRKAPFFDNIDKLRQSKAFNFSLSYYRSSIEGSLNAKDSVEQSVLICGWYGTETLGDKAILGGVIESLQASLGQNIKIVLVAINPYISHMTKLQMPELKSANVVGLEEGVRLAGSCGYCVFGGGPLMAINELAPMQVIFENAKKHGRKTIVAGCGVGPLGENFHNESIRQILLLSDIRIYRDNKSQDYAKTLGVPIQEGEVAEDPAFTWLTKPHSSVISNAQYVDKKVILLGLRDFPYKEYARHLPEHECLAIKSRYENVIVCALQTIVGLHPDVIIRPLPMCTNHFGSDDRWFYRKLFRSASDLKSVLDLSLLGPELPPQEYLAAFENCSVLLAMRFHSLVFGVAKGANCLALDYTLGKGKVKSLAERFNVPVMSLQDLNADDVVDQINLFLESKTREPLVRDQLSFIGVLTKQLTNRK